MGEYKDIYGKYGKTTVYMNKWVPISIADIQSWSSGNILNQLWEENVKKEELNITGTPNLAFYKENRVLS